MAKKIVNTSNTLQINFEKGAKKDLNSSPVFFRFQVIFAAFLFGIGTLLLVAFVSNFFVGVADQSELEQGSIDVLHGSDVPVKNSAGLLGAKIAHFFLFRTFGWSSFLLIPLFHYQFPQHLYPPNCQFRKNKMQAFHIAQLHLHRKFSSKAFLCTLAQLN